MNAIIEKTIRQLFIAFGVKLLFAGLLVSTSSNAYQLMDLKWPEPTTTFYVDIGGANGLWNEAFEAAMFLWWDSASFDYRIVRGTFEDPCNGNDRNGVGWTSDVCGDPYGSTTLAVALSRSRGDTLSESDIVFNINESWNVYSGPYNSGTWSGVNDFRRVAVHELGHALGLNHEDSVPAIMAAAQSFGNTIEIPTSDDIAGVNAIYFGGGGGGGGGCDAPSIGLNETVIGTLSFSDCTIDDLFGDGDTSFVDLYAITLPAPGTLTFRMESTQFDPFLILMDSNLATTFAQDDDSGGGLNSLFSVPLVAGDYVILANSAITGQQDTGTYTLTTSVGVVSPKTDIVIDFPSLGLYARLNDSSWLRLSAVLPSVFTLGNMDGNVEDDVIAAFVSGIFVKRNLGGWAQLHNFTPEAMAVGDLDNNGQDDIVIDFGGIGLWARMNDSNWLKLNNASPTQLVIGDMDGNGQDDVIAVFGSGIFVKRNLGGWAQLHNFTPEAMAVGDLDNNGQDDVVIDFGGIALWARMNDSSWVKLHNTSPELITTGDIDGNGADDVIATFSGSGLWQKINLGGWSQLNANAPDEVVTGDVNGSGKDDVIGDFGSTLGGIFVKRDQGAWVKLHNTSPDSMATGQLDGN